jgi:hypothetical protein
VHTMRKGRKVSKQLVLPNVRLSKLCWSALDPLHTKAPFVNANDSLGTGALALPVADACLEPLHFCLNSSNDHLEVWRDANNKVVKKDCTLRCEEELALCPRRTSWSVQSPEHLTYGLNVHDVMSETEGCYPLQRYAGAAMCSVYFKQMLNRLLVGLSKAMETYSEPILDPATRQDTRSSYQKQLGRLLAAFRECWQVWGSMHRLVNYVYTAGDIG